jgi:hypothetical protein
MIPFRVGDRVRLREDYWEANAGDVGVVTRIVVSHLAGTLQPIVQFSGETSDAPYPDSVLERVSDCLIPRE